MQNITIIDYLLLPVYLFIFYIIVKKKSVSYTDADLRKYFFIAFFLRMFGAVAYSMLVQYYYGYGDSFIYYGGSNYLREQVLADAGNIKYFFAPANEVKSWFDFQVGDIYTAGYYSVTSNLFVMKVSAVISFLAFNKFLIISLFFGFFSFVGQWKLFKVFNDINKGSHLKLLAWAVLFTPSIWFWGSGLMKDSICIGGLGFIVHYTYKILIKKDYALKDILALAFMIYLVGTIKSYIIIIFAVGLTTIIFYSFIAAFKNIIIKSFVVLIFLFAAITIAFLLNFDDQLQIIAEESKAQVTSFQNNYEALQKAEELSKAGFSGGQFDPSVGGMLLYSPVAIFTCLFRPFPWESGKIMILFTSLESMLLLLATLFIIIKLGVFRFFRTIFSNPYLLFSLIISLLFAAIIGFTTFNFGTMVRYKIILLPFYYFMLVNLYIKLKEKQGKV